MSIIDGCSRDGSGPEYEYEAQPSRYSTFMIVSIAIGSGRARDRSRTLMPRLSLGLLVAIMYIEPLYYYN